MDNYRLEKSLSVPGYISLILSYPLGYYFHYFFEDFEIHDSMTIRIGFSLFCILLFIIDKVFDKFILQVKLFQVLHITTVLYAYYLAYENHLGVSYIVGTSIIILNVINSIYSIQFLKTYALVSLLGALLISYTTSLHIVDPWLFFTSLFLLITFFYRNRTKDLQLISEIQNKEQLALQTSKEKTLFLARVVHEIRNPLNGIVNLIHTIKEKNTDQNLQKEIELLNYSTEILLNLFNDLLDSSKVEEGKFRFNYQLCSPKQIAENVTSLFYYKAKEKGIELQFLFTGEDKSYNADPIRIQQILMNLMNNAINYTSKGKVLLELNNHLEEKLLYSTFKVYDTGKGIAPKDQDKIFQKFYRADNNVSGTGLGLYISKTLAELMCGQLTFESPPRDKSEFSTVFILSLAFPILEGIPISEDIIYTSLPIRKVLVVDDDDVNILVLEQILKSLNINFNSVNNSLEGLKLVFLDSYDFILLDIEMPVLNGLEFAKRVKLTDNLSSKSKIIGITGYESESLSETQKEYFDAILNKPISKKNLYNTLKQLT